MPATYEIFPEWQIKYVHVETTIEVGEFLSLADQYFDDRQFDMSLRFLIDLRDLVQSSAKFSDVFTLYSYYRRKLAGRGPIEVAIVAPSDFAYGLSHMFFALVNMGSVMHLEIFETMTDAAAWLEIPIAVAETMKSIDRPEPLVT